MKTNLNKVIIIILVNLILSLIYLVVSIVRKDKKKEAIMSLFMILTPPIGIIYLSVSYLIYLAYFEKRKGVLSVEELSMSKNKIEVVPKDNFKIALNRVPLEEALIVSDKKDTRRLILDVLKSESGDYINSIYSATDNRDGEVAHYAAAAITDIMDKFKKKEKSFKNKYNDDKTDEVLAEQYWEYLSHFLMTEVLSSVEQIRYLKILEDLTLELEKHTPDIVRAELYYRIVIICIDLKLMSQAEFWVNKALECRKNELESYKAGLKFYYACENREKFSKLMNSLKSSNVRLDHETLELIRFYNS